MGLAAVHPWWPHLFNWPRFLDPINWFWDSVKGYAFTSSGLQLSIPLGVLVYLRRHNCQVHHCPRLQWKHTAAGDLVCRHHHPQDAKTATQVTDDHHQALVER
jgi:hypothetical protein